MVRVKETTDRDHRYSFSMGFASTRVVDESRGGDTDACAGTCTGIEAHGSGSWLADTNPRVGKRTGVEAKRSGDGLADTDPRVGPRTGVAAHGSDG